MTMTTTIRGQEEGKEGIKDTYEIVISELNTSILAEAFQNKDQERTRDLASKKANGDLILFLTENAQRTTKSQGTEFNGGAEDEEQPVDKQDIRREVVLFVFDHGQTKGQDQSHNLSEGGKEFKADLMEEAVLTAKAVKDQAGG